MMVPMTRDGNERSAIRTLTLALKSVGVGTDGT
jgi:hypothetical protein